MLVGSQILNRKGSENDGYRVVSNNGEFGCQSEAKQFALHFIGGEPLSWPPGCD
jgi:diadenosine tetraphosphate (Ap4A) HIT family hydrolase